MTDRRQSAGGMTLIELLVVMGIIGILLGVTIPAVQSSRGAARRAHCLSNLRQIGVAMQMYVDVQGASGIFPYAAVVPSVTPDRPSLVDVLAPYIETNQDVFICPSDFKLHDDRPPSKYHEEEGLSYEYPASRLEGKRRPELLVNSQGQATQSSTDVWLAYDFGPFHGKAGQPGSRNYVYLDGHAKSF